MIIFGNETMKACFRESDGMLMAIDSKYGKTSFENHIWEWIIYLLCGF